MERTEAMLVIPNQTQSVGKKWRHDLRIGKRVICLDLLPRMTLLGTIQRMVRYANGVEYWNVQTDGPMTEEAPASHFLLYEGPEFQGGDQVAYRLDEGGHWLATVIRPVWTANQLRFVIRVESSEQAAVSVVSGRRLAAHPGRLSRL